MSQIQVQYKGYPLYLTEDGEWRCFHALDPVNVEIEPPCCTSPGSSGYIECGCGGRYGVYCPDCDNDDMSDSDIENIIEGLGED